MKRSFAAPVALVAVLVAVPLLAACDEATPDALEVNGTTFSQSTVDDELEAIADNDVLNDLQDVTTSDGTIQSEVTAFWLNTLVERAVAEDAMDDAGIEITDADREAGQTRAEEVFTPDGFAAFPESFQDDLVEGYAASNAVQQAIADGNIDVPCASGRHVSHILVETQAEADAILTELEDGADFADTAAESSIDTGSAEQAGFVGCYQPGTFVAEFDEAVADAEIDELTGPIESEFGFHIILVTDEAPSGAAAGGDFTGLVNTAEISVDPRYGSWDKEALRVVPPEPAVPPTS